VVGLYLAPPDNTVVVCVDEKITANAGYPRHCHQEFLKFLKKVAAARPAGDLHVVLDLCRPRDYADTWWAWGRGPLRRRGRWW
jgi:hypothetical protein